MTNPKPRPALRKADDHAVHPAAPVAVMPPPVVDAATDPGPLAPVPGFDPGTVPPPAPFVPSSALVSPGSDKAGKSGKPARPGKSKKAGKSGKKDTDGEKGKSGKAGEKTNAGKKGKAGKKVTDEPHHDLAHGGATSDTLRPPRKGAKKAKAAKRGKELSRSGPKVTISLTLDERFVARLDKRARELGYRRQDAVEELLRAWVDG